MFALPARAARYDPKAALCGSSGVEPTGEFQTLVAGNGRGKPEDGSGVVLADAVRVVSEPPVAESAVTL